MISVVESPSVLVMCGLPASGKTTAAERIHLHSGGVLVRSCDVYRSLGISLPDWVKRTDGFTRHLALYLRERDRAYVEIASTG
jgi:predicted kinase